MLAASWLVGLLSLAALPPTAAFWSKEGVLTAAEHAVGEQGAAPGWVPLTVLVAVGLTSLLTGAYAGRLLAITLRRPSVEVLEEQEPVDDDDFGLVSSLDPDYDPALDAAPTERDRALALARTAPPVEEPVLAPVPTTMRAVLGALALVTAALAALPLLGGAVLADLELELVTAAVGALLAVVGLAAGASRGPDGSPDLADRVPSRTRAVAAGGFGYQAAQDALVVRPVRALARLGATLDRDVVEGYVASPAVAARWGAVVLRRLQTGVVTTYLGWVAGAAVAVGVAAVLVGGGW